MKNLKFLSLAFLTFGAATAQDVEQAKKAIDAEQYQKAKTTLKSLIASSPEEGKNYFFLGNVYLKQKEQDSAAIFFNKGKAVKNNAEYNDIGLGQIDLNNGNASGAQAKFNAVTASLKKRDVEQLVYIGRAYINSDKPDYKKAIEVLNSAIAKDNKNAQAYLSLGDAYYGDRNQNEAYRAYRNALLYDKGLLRADLQMAVITKNTGAAFPDAVKALNAIATANPAYGPVYRELAETYYYWGRKEPAKYGEYSKKALEYYEKYMGLTDYSLNSRMRHADFLLLTGDYKALEAEAKKMQQMDKVNPVILRYLGYAAYENGNYEASLKAMNDFIAKVEPKRIIARDYLYVGLSKLASSVGKDEQGNSIVTNQADFDEGVAELKKAVEKDPKIANEYNEIGKKIFAQKLYGPASAIFEVAASSADNQNAFVDNFYLAYSLYYNHVNKSAEARKANTANLQKADAALAKVIELSAEAQDAYLYKAKVNQQLQTTESYAEMAKNYDAYIRIVLEKGAAEASKPQTKKNLIEAYSNAGAYYAVTDKAKAKQYFGKALELDPNDTYAKSELNKLQ